MPHSLTSVSRLALAVAGAGLLATACGGSSGRAAVAQQPAASGGTLTIETHQGPLGTYLTDASGRALYLFAADKGSTSTCYRACATYWPPLVDSAKPSASGGAQASLVGSTRRTDGSTEVTYAGHPLYYYAGDSGPGDTLGQGSNANGGLWWLVAPDGTPITATLPASSAPASSGGYSY